MTVTGHIQQRECSAGLSPLRKEHHKSLGESNYHCGTWLESSAPTLCRASIALAYYFTDTLTENTTNWTATVKGTSECPTILNQVHMSSNTVVLATKVIELPLGQKLHLKI